MHCDKTERNCEYSLIFGNVYCLTNYGRTDEKFSCSVISRPVKTARQIFTCINSEHSVVALSATVSSIGYSLLLCILSLNSTNS